MRNGRGYTLIEVMIVIVIVGLLAAVALPAYQDSLQKGRRADGMAILHDAANRQERHLLDRSVYTSLPADLGFDSPYTSEEGYYTLSMAACDGGSIAYCYKLTAVPVSGKPQQSDSRCGSLILTSDGNTTASGALGAACW